MIRFRRARGRYEHSRRPHSRNVIHRGEGTWWDKDAAIWRDGRGEGLRCLRTPAKLPIEQLDFSGIDVPATLRVTRGARQRAFEP